jgi:hypothetical protein
MRTWVAVTGTMEDRAHTLHTRLGDTDTFDHIVCDTAVFVTEHIGYYWCRIWGSHSGGYKELWKLLWFGTASFWFLAWLIIWPWRWRWHVPTKCWLLWRLYLLVRDRSGLSRSSRLKDMGTNHDTRSFSLIPTDSFTLLHAELNDKQLTKCIVHLKALTDSNKAVSEIKQAKQKLSSCICIACKLSTATLYNTYLRYFLENNVWFLKRNVPLLRIRICNTFFKCNFKSPLSLFFHANSRYVSATGDHLQEYMIIFVNCYC